MPHQRTRPTADNQIPPSSGPGIAAPLDRGALMCELFEEHNQALVCFLAAKLNSEAEAMDVAQEAYVRLLQLDRFDTLSFPRAYLFRVAANIAMDHLRKRAVRQREDTREHILFERLRTEPGPEGKVIDEQQLSLIKQAVRKLPKKCRKAFGLYLFGDRSVRDIAAEMGLSNRMIRYYISRGLAHCQDALNPID